ncbi:MAG: DUF2283 domain-containing protein [Candidatus Doudnabacteria bacterium]|nr:DUF2283 domain-containing protein [Candidatus Doudnabacteria bacterium]
MKITYDKSIDAAYIYLKGLDYSNTQWVKKTYMCDPAEINGMINLDFDNEGRLGGVEIQGASKKLPKEILDQAEQI